MCRSIRQNRRLTYLFGRQAAMRLAETCAKVSSAHLSLYEPLVHTIVTHLSGVDADQPRDQQGQEQLPRDESLANSTRESGGSHDRKMPSSI